ncbi:hypothetical protein RS130_21125 [Paraglaciecola aquimarina]|uniref:Uncharacterized protein n=1 Tax=Paraglaciecola aquimarina TaxID=1235557 RepID=A0ABU3T1B2_9ALTE|nr:hypothetical protein [Paraglaciecola aquimarina]MDU0356061.1 hypothetical protein [Paraglaciecola aquimarina]
MIANIHASESTADTEEKKILQLSYLLSLNNVYGDFYSKYDGVTPDMYKSLGLEIESVDNALDFSNLQLMSALALFSPSTFAIY